MIRKLLTKIFITVLGATLILWSVEDLALGVFGERTTAVVTHIRREGGERAEAVPNRYTYNISYTFTLPDGTQIDGTSKKIGGASYIKANGTGKIAVRYFKGMPYLNALEKSSFFSLGHLILIATGIFLIIEMHRKQNPLE